MLKRLEDIGHIVQRAHDFNPRNWRPGAVSNTAGYSSIGAVEALFALLDQRNVEYVLVGGVALLYYVEGRNTQDLDLITPADALENVPEIRLLNRDVDFARGEFRGLQIDFLLTENPLFRKVSKEYTKRVEFLGREIALATVEGLLLLKLYALPSLYRQGNFVRVALYENDISALMYEFEPDMGHLLAELAEYIGEGDRKALREIVSEIEQRVARFKDKAGDASE